MGKQKPELPQGTLDMLILKALSLGPMHGYGVGQRIGQLAEEMLKVEEGTLYPALHRLERRGWIASEWGVSESNRRAKFYKLTAAGRARFRAQTPVWHRHAEAIAVALRRTSVESA